MAKPNTAVKAVPDSDDEVPEDLNAAVVTLEWKDQTFTLPKRRGRWPTRAAREFARENYLEAIIALIGEEAYQRLEELCPVVDDMNEFADYAGATINRECIA
uniref:Tail assembly chaperone n=1 Tax=Mycobacterium phage JustASigh TaxID=3158894 RepID=A0AAU8GMR7_9CAUD